MSLVDFSAEIGQRSILLRNIVKKSCETLHNSNHHFVKSSLDYLKSRFSNQTIKDFEFGFLPSADNFSDFDFSISDLKEANIFYNSSSFTSLKTIFPNHPIIFPYCDEYGNCVSLIARTILSENERKDQQIDKYKNLFFNKTHFLFNLEKAKKEILKKGYAILVEGQFDVVKANQSGILNVVAICGSKFSYHQMYLLSKYTSNVYLLFDTDKPGELANKKTRQNNLFSMNFISLRLPSRYKDLDEYLDHNSKNDFDIFLRTYG